MPTPCAGTARPATTRSTTLTLTDPASGTGVWIRQTMLAPRTAAPGECAVWFVAMTPDGARFGAQAVAAARPRSAPTAEPFQLCDRRRRADRPRDGRGSVDGRGLGAVAGSRAAARRARPPAAAPRGRRADRPRRCRTPTWRSPGRWPSAAAAGARRRPGRRRRTSGAPSTPSAGPGRTAATSRRSTASRGPDTFFDGVSVFVPRGGREVGPEHARRRAGSAARTSRRRRRCGPPGARAASA